jgi:hypothetical protein
MFKKQFFVVIFIVFLFLVLLTITGVEIFFNWKSINQEPVAFMTAIVALISLGMVVCSIVWLINLHKEMPFKQLD